MAIQEAAWSRSRRVLVFRQLEDRQSLPASCVTCRQSVNPTGRPSTGASSPSPELALRLESGAATGEARQGGFEALRGRVSQLAEAAKQVRAVATKLVTRDLSTARCFVQPGPAIGAYPRG